jgi:Na+-transporting NADH:ubiquinone oxidoreductase subunit D
VAISLLRHHLPSSVRLIVQMTVIASSVIVIDEVLKAYVPRMSETLSVFVSLIITNCIVLARSEAFAMSHGVGMSLLDGIGNGIGYSLILVAVAVVRELFGTGGLMGYQFFTLVEDGGWFQPNRMMLLAPSAFFIIGFMIWGIRRWKTEQVEQPDFEEAPTPLGHPEAA